MKKVLKMNQNKVRMIALISGILVTMSACDDDVTEPGLSCDAVAAKTAGPTAYDATDFFACPNEVTSIEDIQPVVAIFLNKTNVFDDLWGLATGFLDTTRITSCESDNDTVCEAADYTDGSGVSVQYHQVSTQNGINSQEQNIIVTLPPGAAMWSRLEVHRLTNLIYTGAFYLTSIFEASASWTGKIQSDWPANYSISAEDNENSNRGGSQHTEKWQHAQCEVQRSTTVTVNIANPLDGNNTVTSDYRINGVPFRTATDQFCSTQTFDIVRVSTIDQCLGLARSDSLEYVGVCH